MSIYGFSASVQMYLYLGARLHRIIDTSAYACTLKQVGLRGWKTDQQCELLKGGYKLFSDQTNCRFVFYAYA